MLTVGFTAGLGVGVMTSTGFVGAMTSTGFVVVGSVRCVEVVTAVDTAAVASLGCAESIIAESADCKSDMRSKRQFVL